MQEQRDPAQAKFDRVRGGLEGLPGTRMTQPSTVIQAIPIIGTVVSYIIETWKDDEHGFVMFLQLVDADGRERFILPNKVLRAIYRQRDRLADRSTPESRARKKRAAEVKKRRAEKKTRQQRFAGQT